MGIQTVFAQIACSDIEVSAEWYRKLFGREPVRAPTPQLVEFQFAYAAEVQLLRRPDDAGRTNLTLGVLPMQPERDRLVAAGLQPSMIERTDDYYSMWIRDPDGNLLMFASAELN